MGTWFEILELTFLSPTSYFCLIEYPLSFSISEKLFRICKQPIGSPSEEELPVKR